MNKKEIIAQLNECRRVRAEWGREYTLRDRKMNDAQIKHMVDRFLMWRLPEDFHPDCGIHFDARWAIDGTPCKFKVWFGRCEECDEGCHWNENGTYAANGKHPFDIVGPA